MDIIVSELYGADLDVKWEKADASLIFPELFSRFSMNSSAYRLCVPVG